jgi:hypothetical protein
MVLAVMPLIAAATALPLPARLARASDSTKTLAVPLVQ